MNVMEFFEFLKEKVSENNVEIIKDSFDNIIYTFIPIDDCAISFCFNGNNEFQSAWVNS